MTPDQIVILNAKAIDDNEVLQDFVDVPKLPKGNWMLFSKAYDPS